MNEHEARDILQLGEVPLTREGLEHARSAALGQFAAEGAYGDEILERQAARWVASVEEAYSLLSSLIDTPAGPTSSSVGSSRSRARAKPSSGSAQSRRSEPKVEKREDRAPVELAATPVPERHSALERETAFSGQDYADQITLAVLTATGWALSFVPGSSDEKAALWEAVVTRWVTIKCGVSFTAPGPAYVSGLVQAMNALRPPKPGEPVDGRAKFIRAEAEGRVRSRRDDPAAMAEALGDFGPYCARMPRHGRRWLAEAIARMMDAILHGEVVEGSRPRSVVPDEYMTIRRAIIALGFRRGDWESDQPAGGQLALPGTFDWWQPFATLPDGAPLDPATARGTAEAHARNVLSFNEKTGPMVIDWYEKFVLQHIDDYGSRSGAPASDFGDSGFSSAAPYHLQSDRVLSLLWAFADSLLEQAREAERVDDPRHVALRDVRLPLGRAIWNGELSLAANRILGYGIRQPRPDWRAPGYKDWVFRVSDVERDVRAEALRLWHLKPDDVPYPADGRSAYQIVTTVRAAGANVRARATRKGCGGSAAVAVAAFVAMLTRL